MGLKTFPHNFSQFPIFKFNQLFAQITQDEINLLFPIKLFMHECHFVVIEVFASVYGLPVCFLHSFFSYPWSHVFFCHIVSINVLE